jgi:hypothetical protein
MDLGQVDSVVVQPSAQQRTGCADLHHGPILPTRRREHESRCRTARHSGLGHSARLPGIEYAGADTCRPTSSADGSVPATTMPLRLQSLRLRRRKGNQRPQETHRGRRLGLPVTATVTPSDTTSPDTTREMLWQLRITQLQIVRARADDSADTGCSPTRPTTPLHLDGSRTQPLAQGPVQLLADGPGQRGMNPAGWWLPKPNLIRITEGQP